MSDFDKVVFSLKIELSDRRKSIHDSSLNMIVRWNGVDLRETGFNDFNDSLDNSIE